MQFALLIYQPALVYQPWKLADAGLSETEMAGIGKEYAEIGATPGLVSRTPLGYPKDATTVRVQDGKTITSEGTVGGPDVTVSTVYLFEAKDKDGAIEFASRIPAARIGGAIEVRPVEAYY